MQRTAISAIVMLAFAISPAQAANLIVSNAGDAVNGATSNPQALRANPGADGISLREAIMAANNAIGPHRITFASTLTGNTINLKSPLPPIRRNGVSIIGRANAAGQPTISISAKNAVGLGPTIFVGASSFTMRAMRFTYVPDDHAVQIGGVFKGVFVPAKTISGVTLVGNAFSDAGHDSNGFAVCIKTSGFPQGPTNDSTISNVVIAHNKFSAMFQAVAFAIGGNRNVVKDVIIFRNVFTEINIGGPRNDGSPLEIAGSGGKNNRILGTQVLENVFSGNLKGIDINNNSAGQDMVTSANIIKDTVIERNIFKKNLNSQIQFVAGVDRSSNNVIASTRIVNNLIERTASDIGVAIQDNDLMATNNRVTGVLFANNTVIGGIGGGIGVASTGGVSGVKIINSILADGSMREITAAQVYNSITSAFEITGTNGNIDVDPQFVNPSRGNYHLQLTSPALGAGRSAAAPTETLDCQPRPVPPAIGAYETRAANRCPNTYP